MKAKSRKPAADTDPANRKMAPRSSNQFRVGPPFGATKLIKKIVDDEGNHMKPQIAARIDRGFDMIDGKWIGYKRNYFTLVACFQFADAPLDVCTKSRFLYLESNERFPLTSFKLRLRHTCRDQEHFRTTLVQHTAKRDRGPQFEPPEYQIVPGELPPHDVMRELANIRNGPKISFYDRLFYMLEKDRETLSEQNSGILSTYPTDCRVSLVARYERIQFQTTAIGPRRAAASSPNLTFLEVQLVGVGENGSEIVLATAATPPLTVRGRSPLNYTRQKPNSWERAEENETNTPETQDQETQEQVWVEEVQENEENNEKREKLGKCRRPDHSSLKKRGRVLGRNRNLENLATPGVADMNTMQTLTRLSRLPPIDGFNFHETVSMLQPATLSREMFRANFDPVLSSWGQYNSDEHSALDVSNGEIRSFLGNQLSFSPTKKFKMSNGWKYVPPLNVPATHFSANLFSTYQPGYPNFSVSKKRHQPHIHGSRSKRPRLSILLVEDSTVDMEDAEYPDLLFVNTTEDDFLNIPHNAFRNSPKCGTPTGGFCSGFPGPSMLCPLGCFLMYPCASHEVFLQTSTPSPFLPEEDTAHALRKKKGAETQCKHGRKKRRRRSRKAFQPQDLSLENYDSSFGKFRASLDKIKKAIRFEPHEDLSPLSSLHSRSGEDAHLLWEELVDFEGDSQPKKSVRTVKRPRPPTTAVVQVPICGQANIEKEPTTPNH